VCPARAVAPYRHHWARFGDMRAARILAVVLGALAVLADDQRAPETDSRAQGRPRVAIVGGGIGGAAAAYYTQQLLRNASAPPASIRVYERNGPPSRLGPQEQFCSWGPKNIYDCKSLGAIQGCYLILPKCYPWGPESRAQATAILAAG
jgi:hypothetical protein